MADTRVVSLPYEDVRHNNSHLTRFWILGVPLFLFGVAALAALRAGLAVQASDARWEILAAAWIFLVGGLVLTSISAYVSRAGHRYLRRARRRPGEPWLADHGWDPAGDRDHGLAAAARGLVLLLPGAAIVGFAHTAMMSDLMPGPALPLIRWLLTGLLALAGARWMLVGARSLRHGAGWIRFGRFPFFLGETLDVLVGSDAGLDRFDAVTVTLRFVRVRHADAGDGIMSVAEQHWAETVHVTKDALRGDALAVSIVLPTGDYGTSLSGHPPRYWEMETKGTAHGGAGFGARFLVPIYAAPEKR